MKDDKTSRVSITLRNSQVKNIEEHLNSTKKFTSVANFFQVLVDEYFNKINSIGWRRVILLIVYPILIATIMLYVGITSTGVNKILWENGITTDLLIYTQTYYLIGFLFFAIMIAGFIFIIGRRKSEK